MPPKRAGSRGSKRAREDPDTSHPLLASAYTGEQELDPALRTAEEEAALVETNVDTKILVEANGPRCTELRHIQPGRSPLVHLVRGNNEIFWLEHSMTGERKALEAGCNWQLKNKDGFCYVKSPG